MFLAKDYMSRRVFAAEFGVWNLCQDTPEMETWLHRISWHTNQTQLDGARICGSFDYKHANRFSDFALHSGDLSRAGFKLCRGQLGRRTSYPSKVQQIFSQQIRIQYLAAS